MDCALVHHDAGSTLNQSFVEIKYRMYSKSLLLLLSLFVEQIASPPPRRSAAAQEDANYRKANKFFGQGVNFPGGAPPLTATSLHQLASGEAPVVVGRATARQIADGQRQANEQLHLIGAMGANPGHQYNPANPRGPPPPVAPKKGIFGRRFQDDGEDDDQEYVDGDEDLQVFIEDLDE
jgi:hypothetical protein